MLKAPWLATAPPLSAAVLLWKRLLLSSACEPVITHSAPPSAGEVLLMKLEWFEAPNT